jgi:mRNA interferase MazF
VIDAVRRGDVILVRLDPTEGRELRKTRPAVILSNDVACRFDAVVQVVPVSGIPDRELRPYEARIESEHSGMREPSRALASQIRTVARHRLLAKLGAVTASELEAVERAVLIQLGVRKVP